MLKKKNIFVAILSFLFCFSMFGGILNFADKRESNSSDVVALVPSLEESDEGEYWNYDSDSSTLTLNGNVYWSETLYVSTSIEIVLSGENNIDVDDDFAIYVSDGATITISGTGSLNLKSNTNVIYFESDNSDDLILETDVHARNNGSDFNSNSEVINASEVEFYSIASSFDMSASQVPVDIVATNKTITYSGSTYDVSGMFDIESTGVGQITYSLSSDGLSEDIATGTLDGSVLTITKCGQINVKIQVAENEAFSATEKTATLTINRKTLVVGTEEGQLQIVYSKGIVDSVEYFTDNWIEDGEILEPEVRNNIGGGAVQFSYWIDDDCLEPTTVASHGASEENGAPNVMGIYYVKAEVAETNFYNSASVVKQIKVKRAIPVTSNNSLSSIDYNQIIDGKFDMSELFSVDSAAISSVESITYSYRLKTDKFPSDSEDGKLSILSVSENGDTYEINISIDAKSDSLYEGCGLGIDLTVNKPEVDTTQIVVGDKAFDGTPYDISSLITIGHNPFDGAETISFFKDAECTVAVTENSGIPISGGAYFAKVEIAETNYTKKTTAIMSFNITGIQIEEIVWTENDFTYNGEVQEITAYYLDINEEPVYLAVSVDSEFKNVKESGHYTATATFANGETSYTLPDNTKQYDIKKMAIYVTVNNRDSKYGWSVTELSADVTSGTVFGDDEPYVLSIKDMPGGITTETPVGQYEISAQENDSNYDVTFAGTAYYYVLNLITTNDMIENWVYRETANEPSAQDLMESQIEFTYYTFDRKPLEVKPEMPGTYYLYANVESQNWWEEAYKEELFIIDRIEISIPQADSTVYTYNYFKQEYKVNDIDPLNKELYTVGETSFRDAGTHKVRLTIKEPLIYRWPNGESVYEFDFVINKKVVEKPAVDSRMFKYNGNPQTYNIASSIDYIISSDVTKTEVGRYKVVVSLAEPNNTMWADGTTDNLEYDFVINQNQITNATIKDSAGNNVDSNDVLLINVSGGGLNPDVKLSAEIFDTKDSEELKTIKAQLGTLMKKYDKIFKVADVSLVLNEESIQPENNITLKMLVPKELVNTNFRLYHIHIDGNGKEIISEIDYSDVDENGYIVFQTDKLSSFVFVYKQTSLLGLVITFVVLTVLMLALLVVQLIWFKKNKTGAKTAVASAVPVFYVASELGSVIAFGVVFGLLLIGNAVMLALNLKLKRANSAKKLPAKKTASSKAK